MQKDTVKTECQSVCQLAVHLELYLGPKKWTNKHFSTWLIITGNLEVDKSLVDGPFLLAKHSPCHALPGMCKARLGEVLKKGREDGPVCNNNEVQ